MAKQDTADVADTAGAADAAVESDAAAEVHELMTVKQAAEYLQVNPKTLYRWLAAGKIPGVRLGDRSWRLQRATLDGWVRRRSIENTLANAPRVTQEWLDGVQEHRERALEHMGGEPFRGDEIDRLIDEGRR